jgi:hypothetical protein
MRHVEINGHKMDVYPVGWLQAWKSGPRRWNHLKREWRSVVYWARRRNWRAVRNTFNGYLAEHEHGGHNAGRGWTKRRAIRRVEAICRRATEQR